MAKIDLIHVAVEPAMKAKLIQRANSEGLPMSAIIRMALRDFLEGKRKPA